MPRRPAQRSRKRAAFAALAALATLTVSSIVAVVPSDACADRRRSPSPDDALPRGRERLARPFVLPHCGAIVEWTPTPQLRAETSPSPRALRVIEDTCAKAIAMYPAFLDSLGLPYHALPTLGPLPEMSLLPANVLLDGSAPRHLNDLATRFGAVADACCYWGLYVDGLAHLFLRNDPLVRGDGGKLRPNEQFVRTLEHELAHFLNSRLGVLEYADRKRDEELAEEFVAYLDAGTRAPPESSWDDLAHHHAIGNTSASVERTSSTLPESAQHLVEEKPCDD